MEFLYLKWHSGGAKFEGIPKNYVSQKVMHLKNSKTNCYIMARFFAFVSPNFEAYKNISFPDWQNIIRTIVTEAARVD